MMTGLELKTILRLVYGNLRVAAGLPETRLPFTRFEVGVHPQTWRRHAALLEWARRAAADADRLESDAALAACLDPAVRVGLERSKRVCREFHNLYAGLTDLRILVHVPPSAVSPGGYSLFTNLLDGLRHIGIHAEPLEWGNESARAIDAFEPTVLLSSDNEPYLERLDWDTLARWQKRGLRIGLTASLERYGNTPLQARLAKARERGVSFYYSFRAPEYIQSQCREFLDRGLEVLSIEFGANPLTYRHVPGVARDLDYVFLASSNPDKWPRYFEYLPDILASRPGMIDGPGWSNTHGWAPRETHRFLYARARVGINLHISDSIDLPSELNERTYILAACGVPQVIDAPRLLDRRFEPGCFFVGADPAQYAAAFEQALSDPAEASRRALLSQEQVLSRHTSFHRAQDLVHQLHERVFKTPLKTRAPATPS